MKTLETAKEIVKTLNSHQLQHIIDIYSDMVAFLSNQKEIGYKGTITQILRGDIDHQVELVFANDEYADLKSDLLYFTIVPTLGSFQLVDYVYSDRLKVGGKDYDITIDSSTIQEIEEILSQEQQEIRAVL